MATIKGLLALSTLLVTLGACASSGASKAELDKAFNDGIHLGRSQNSGQSSGSNFGNASASGHSGGVAVRGFNIQPAGASVYAPGTKVTHGNCHGMNIRFRPSLAGNPNEQAIYLAVQDYLCTPNATATGTIAGFTFTAGLNGQ